MLRLMQENNNQVMFTAAENDALYSKVTLQFDGNSNSLNKTKYKNSNKS